MDALNMRWSTDLVTFFHPPHWGLPADLSFADWDRTVTADPLPYFSRMLDEAAAAGLSAVELAPAPGGWRNALRAYGSAEEFGAELSKRGLQLSGSYVLPEWLAAILAAPHEDARAQARSIAAEEFRTHALFLRALGCETIITSTVPRAQFSETEGIEASAEDFHAPADQALLENVADEFNRLAQAIKEEGGRLAIHTDAYSLASRVVDVDRLMELTAKEQVGLVIDAGHIALDNGDPVEILRRHVGRAPALHWKDCSVHLPPHTLSGPPMVRHDEMIRYFRVLGSGAMVDWPTWTKTLKHARWDGWSVAELDMSPDPLAEIRAGIEYYETMLAQS
jgi:sugar phosphate isomerase/epimerase